MKKNLLNPENFNLNKIIFSDGITHRIITDRNFLIFLKNTRCKMNKEWYTGTNCILYNLDNYILFLKCLNIESRKDKNFISIYKYFKKHRKLEFRKDELKSYNLYELNYEILKL